MITATTINHWFSYHPPKDDEQIKAYTEIREAARVFALSVLQHTPQSADQTAAIRKIREAVATSNAAIACQGR
jgi:hypothetical protein